MREQGTLCFSGDQVAFPGVLRGVGGREDDASESCALEGFSGADTCQLGALGTASERPAVAAIEDDDLALRKTAVHASGNERRLDRSPGEKRQLRIAQRQVQMPLLILDAVPGEVQEQQIVALSLVVGAGDRLSNLGAAFVAECDDLVELTDCGRLEDPLERIDIHAW